MKNLTYGDYIHCMAILSGMYAEKFGQELEAITNNDITAIAQLTKEMEQISSVQDMISKAYAPEGELVCD